MATQSVWIFRNRIPIQSKLDWPRNIFTFYQNTFSQDNPPLERLVKREYTTVKEKFKLDRNSASYLVYFAPKQGKLQSALGSWFSWALKAYRVDFPEVPECNVNHNRKDMPHLEEDKPRSWEPENQGYMYTRN